MKHIIKVKKINEFKYKLSAVGKMTFLGLMIYQGNFSFGYIKYDYGYNTFRFFPNDILKSIGGKGLVVIVKILKQINKENECEEK